MLPVFNLESFLILTFSGLLVWAAISDLASWRIPNRIPLAVSAFYFIFVLVNPNNIDPLGGIVTGASLLLIGFVFFATGTMGGGDVKLMAAIGLWAGPQNVIVFLIITGLVGGGVALVTLALAACTRLRLMVANVQTAVLPSFVPAPSLRGKIPYGVAVAAGGLCVAAQLL